jgi:hypothetical protein
MRIEGRRIQIAGSADRAMPAPLLRYAHDLVAELVRVLAAEGATFVLGVGREPRAYDDPSAPPIVYYWTALNAIQECLECGTARASSPQGRLVVTITTSKTEDQIPDLRRPLWEALRGVGTIELEFIEPGWSAGAVRRVRQAQRGDILIVLGGGEGVEHLAQEYAVHGKPVIPLDCQIGSSSADGSGGATLLAQKALAHPGAFMRVADPNAAADLLAKLTTRQGERPPAEVAQAAVNLIRALEPPTVFYVRLLNPTVPEYSAVERFFRQVVDPLVVHFGYQAVEMGLGENSFPWMNEAIFTTLHYCAVAVVDLTGLRNDCFMELGYALGRAKRVMLTAQAGTKLSFDSQPFECHFWEDSADDPARIVSFQNYWRRNMNRPPLVQPRSLL